MELAKRETADREAVIVSALRRSLGEWRQSLEEAGAPFGLNRKQVWRLAKKYAIPRPSRVEQLIRASARPQTLAKKRAHLKRLHANPAFCAVRDAAILRASSDPEFRRRCSKAMLARMSDPEFRAAALARLEALRRDPRAQRRRWAGLNGLKADIPLWVPRDLVPDFIDFALSFGEEEAASRVRRLKREAA